jgi:hypothetical protein
MKIVSEVLSSTLAAHILLLVVPHRKDAETSPQKLADSAEKTVF